MRNYKICRCAICPISDDWPMNRVISNEHSCYIVAQTRERGDTIKFTNFNDGYDQMFENIAKVPFDCTRDMNMVLSQSEMRESKKKDVKISFLGMFSKLKFLYLHGF